MFISNSRKEVNRMNYNNIGHAKTFNKGDMVNIINKKHKSGQILAIDCTTPDKDGFKGWIQVKWGNKEVNWYLASNLERYKKSKKHTEADLEILSAMLVKDNTKKI